MKPMLAGKFPGVDKLRFPLYVQPKLDGIRAVVVGGKLLSRTLKPIPNAEIRAALERSEFEGFDGELIVGDPTAEDCYRRTCSFVMAEDKTGEPWSFMVFDLWNHPGTFTARSSILALMSAATPPYMSFLTGRESMKLVRDLDELNAAEAAHVAAGYEGAILRGPYSYYKFGRGNATNCDLLKMKRFEDFEAMIVGAVEEQHNTNEAKTNALGRTERSTAKAGKVGKETLGKLVCRRWNASTQAVEGPEFGVGTGFSADERRELWKIGYKLPGLLVKVKSFPVGVKDKPRHPVFLGFRDPIDIGDPS